MLGGKLFVQKGKHIVPTEYGRYLHIKSHPKGWLKYLYTYVIIDRLSYGMFLLAVYHGISLQTAEG